MDLEREGSLYMSKPLLTIGMIVKNEIRCLERCLKALQPLRDAIPCELIIADTGSDDGTREIAEKYADIAFDFPWINDFAAARNSVIDRASGKWFLTVDADEYLDDCQELVEFLRSPGKWENLLCGVIIRNYVSADMVGSYGDFMALRMIRMGRGIRYKGAIHEAWTLNGNIQVHGFRKTVFRHDGYVNFTGEEGMAKRKRNMELLKAKLEESPHDMKTLSQCIDSSVGEEQLSYVRRALEELENKNAGSTMFGPSIFGSAVQIAFGMKLPEFWDWVHRAEELFPDSLFIRTAINHIAIARCVEEQKYPEVIRRGKIYHQADEDYKAGRFNVNEMCVSSLMIGPEQNNSVCIFVAEAYFQEKQYEEARDTLLSLDGGTMNASQTSNYMSIMLNTHAQSDLDMSSHMADFWRQINKETPTKEWAAQRKREIQGKVANSYTTAFRRQENELQRVRHAYTLFLSLKGECELGTAAAVLETQDASELGYLLSLVQKWEEFPIPALSHALQCGAQFPPPEKSMKMEEMDLLASRLAQSQNDMEALMQKTDTQSGVHYLAWEKSLIIAAVCACKWEDEEQGMRLARTFGRIEREFLSFSYTTDALQPDNLSLLPPMHRFGWYCDRAFEALDNGDAQGYVRNLRQGLSTYGNMKDMVEFLIKHTPQLQATAPSQELLDLADKVRGMLLALDPDDPAVEAIKQSPVYRRVAYLIEGIQAPVMGGLKQ